MYHRLYSYLQVQKILYPLQFGFREKCSTTHALISITESIRQSIDRNEFGCGIFIDLKKAFDAVNHAILLTKHSSKLKPSQSLRIKIDGTLIKQVDSTKYLGIIFDSNLTWKSHINELCLKLSKTVGILSKVRHFVDNHILVMLYYSLIYPFLTYGVHVWGLRTFSSFLTQLSIVQKKAIRIISFSEPKSHLSLCYQCYLSVVTQTVTPLFQ